MGIAQNSYFDCFKAKISKGMESRENLFKPRLRNRNKFHEEAQRGYQDSQRKKENLEILLKKLCEFFSSFCEIKSRSDHWESNDSYWDIYNLCK